jgi:threonine aldolase
MIDLRSDLVSRPTPEMVAAMVQAAQSRCFFELREDPYQKRLEETAARLLGKEDALFFPTCTMCNQTAIHIFCSPGASFICESESHVVESEAGAPAALTGAMPKLVPGEMGLINLTALKEATRPGGGLKSTPSLIVVENTHNRSGGTVLSPSQMKSIQAIAHDRNLPVHLDGARLFNAAIYLNIPVSQISCYADSVSISLNKGLSAPMGALLAGEKDFIEEALRVRQMFGGGWRPTSILAAAGIVALETMVDRLIEDHHHAAEIAKGIADFPGLHIDLSHVQTNLVIINIEPSHCTLTDLIDRLKERNVWVIPFGKNRIRMAVHREITEAEVNATISAFDQILGHSL